MKAKNSSVTVRASALIGVVAFSGLFFINLCDLLYQCGCSSLWKGAAESCNIHGPLLPHCPWCVDQWTGAMVFAGVMAGQTGCLLWPGAMSLGLRLLGAVLTFPAVGGLLGLVVGLSRGYWG